MRRREFLGVVGGAAAWPLVAGAQQAAMPVVGILDSAGTSAVAAFQSGLRDEGYIENSNLAIVLRATDQYDRLPALATELVRNQVAVIAALGGPSAPVAKAATVTIPIVFSIGGDPVELGLVSSLNRPGGNITGTTFFAAKLLEKQVGILHEMAPKATVFGVLVNPKNPRAQADVNTVQAAARTLGLEIHVVNAGTENDLDSAFSSLLRQHTDTLLVCGDPNFDRARARIVGLAARHSVLTLYFRREFVEVGGLMSYGTRINDASRQAGIYVGRILKGAKPSELPIVQPAKFEFVLNLKTGKALGLTVPPGLLMAADEVIE